MLFCLQNFLLYSFFLLPLQVRVLGVAFGFKELNDQTRVEVRNLEGTTDILDEEEARQLNELLQTVFLKLRGKYVII